MMKDENKSVRYYVLKCIENNKLIEALPQIRNIALADANWEVRIKAIDVIREFNDKNALYVLIKSVSDANRDIRHASAAALRDLRIAGAAYPVSVQLATEEDDGIKNVLIEALIRIRNTGGLTGLQKILLTDKNAGLRVRAAFALGEIGDARSVTLLYQGLNDGDPKVKAEVCNSLAVFRGAHATVIKLLDVVNAEQDNYVRLSALYALQRLGDRTTILPLFDLYGVETDPVFREKLRITLRRFLER
jgi:HEAT repeat protein